MMHHINGVINGSYGSNGNLHISDSPRASPQMAHRSIAQIYLSSPSNASNTSASSPISAAFSATTNHTPNHTPQSMHNNSASSPTSTPSPPSPPPTDVIGAIIGDFGIYQLRTVLILFLCKIPASWFMACVIFTAPALEPRTEFQCSAALNANQTVSANQCKILTEEQTQIGNDSMMYVEQQPCNSFTYNYDFTSLIMQYNLVCARDIFVAWTQYWHLFGVLVGGVVATKMMLRLSPRTVYIIGMIVQIMFGVVTGYSTDLSMHCAFRCLSAICCALMFTSAQTIFTDITGGTYRTCIIMLYDTFWSIGIILLPGLASFFNNWSHIYLGITFPTMLLLLLIQWTPESPRWLLKNGDDRDINEVENMVREAAAINDRTFKIPADFRQQLMALRAKLKAQPEPASWLQLWQGGKRTKTHMIAAHLALAIYIVNFMGMLLNLRSFGRDYLVPNTIAMGFSEIAGCFIALHFTLKHNKWKYQYAGTFNIIAGIIGCLGWTFTSVDLSSGLKVTLWMIIAIIPKASVSCAQSMQLACMAELMPLSKKAPFVFSVVTWSRIWLLSAPFINLFKRIDIALSLSAYCVLTICGGICTCLLLTPRSTTTNMVTVEDANQSNKKEQSPLTTAVWTVEGDVNNTRL